MEVKQLLKEIENFKKKLKEYRILTEGHVEQWNSSTDLDKKINPSKEDEINYEKLKSELGQKYTLFGKNLKNKTRIITSNSETGKKIRERPGIGYILTISDNLRDERLIIYNFNIPDKETHKKIWSIVAHGIEKYIGGLKYFNEMKKSGIEKESERVEEVAEKVMSHCFKTGTTCAHSIKEEKNQIFIGMPFSGKYNRIYSEGISPAVIECGFKPWIANESLSNIDIMCKICKAIQTSSYVIIDITEWNPNVLFELGLAYGLGKIVMLIKDKREKEPPVDLRGIEYIPYNSEEDLKKQIIKFLGILSK